MNSKFALSLGTVLLGLVGISDAFARPAPEIVLITPHHVTLGAGQQQQFTAWVLGTSNKNVIWSIANSSNEASGTISVTGEYTAPATIGSGRTVVVTAISGANHSNFGKATIHLVTNPTKTNPLTIITNSLPNGLAGTSYAASLSASGGTTPYNWSISTGSLPAGLSLSSSTGLLSGTPTPTSSGSSTFTVQVGSSNAPTALATSATSTVSAATKLLSITITTPKINPMSVTTTSLVNGQVGTPYSQTLVASGGTTPYAWTLTSGTLPGGLTLNASTGVISGTPTATANATALTFKAADSSSPAQTANVNLTLTIAATTLKITTTSLSSGQIGTPYSQTLTASGGTTPYAWTLTSGTLPGGLTLNASTGVISGTPRATANATALTFKVTDFSSPIQMANVSLTLTIATTTLKITSTSLSSGQVGTPYSQTLAANGGTTPYAWTLTSGTLPGGLTLNASTGVISGTPTATANATALAFTVTDSSSSTQTANVSLTLTIAATTLKITSTSLAGGQVGTPYSQTLTASGSTTPYAWTLTSGTLPGGLTLNASTGVISGTPTATANATTLTFKAADSSTPAQTANVSLTLTITNLTITTLSLQGGQAGMPYSQTLAATGGTAPYMWALTSGTLPRGLTLNTSTGVISGTPTTAANAAPLTIKVTDSTTPAAQTDTASFTMPITSYSVVLSWGASSSSPISGYNVYRSTVSGSGYRKLNSAPVAGLTYTDTAVAAGQTYYYVTMTVSSSGNESALSNQIQEIIP